MPIDRPTFVDASRSQILRVRAAPELATFDRNGSGAIDTRGELGRVYDHLSGQGQPALKAAAAKMEQAPATSAGPGLGDRKLEDVAALAPIFAGIGRLVKKRGFSAGTKPVQQALGLMSDRLPNLPGADPGTPDGKFGSKTERAVRAFQASSGDLAEDGEVGPATLKEIDSVLFRARTMPVNEPRTGDPSRLFGIFYGDRFGSQAALTFDDGPAPNSRIVLRALEDAGVKATFFVVGRDVARHPQILREMVDAGHEIGSHTYSHPDLRRKSADQIQEELDMTQAAVDDALGRALPLKMFRPPYGAVNPRAKAVLAGNELATCWWQGDSNDWRAEVKRSKQKFLNNLRRMTQNGVGGLALFHCIHRTTGQRTSDAIRFLQDGGLEIVTTADLLAAKGIIV